MDEEYPDEKSKSRREHRVVTKSHNSFSIYFLAYETISNPSMASFKLDSENEAFLDSYSDEEVIIFSRSEVTT